MREYLFGIVLVAAVGGIAEGLLPDASRLRPHMRLCTGLCVLLALVLPLGSILGSLSEVVRGSEWSDFFADQERLEEYESIFSGALDGYGREEAARYLSSAVAREFSLDEENCRASLTLGENGEAVRAVIFLSGRAILADPHAIAAYVSRLLSCACDVVVEP